MVKRGRGRPKGSRDKHPRRRPVSLEVLRTPSLSVEQRVKLLDRPQRLSVYSKISGLSVGLLRKKVIKSEITSFHRDGILLVEPTHFLEWWTSARLPKREPRAPDWEKRAILQLATVALPNAADKSTFDRVARRARLLTFIPEDRWLEIEWLDGDEDEQ
jgi:hypothetical protein